MLFGFMTLALPGIAAVSLLLYLPYGICCRSHFGRQTFLCHLVKYAFVGYCLSLLYLTILWYYPDITFRPEYYFLNLRPFVWVHEVYDMGVRKMTEQLLLNIGMFVPLGLLLPLAVSRARKLRSTALSGLAVTLTIEILQYFMGRSADIDDVIMNFVGGVLGYLVFALFEKHFRHREWWHRISIQACKE